MIVSDTCLVFHLFNYTALTTEAQKILNKDPHWILPPLWKEEYANVLSKLARQEKQSLEKVIDHFKYTVGELKNCERLVDTSTALEISITYKINVYDAHFIALALFFDTLLITEDKEVLKKCPKLAISIERFLS